jgi:hypothetical protein
MLITRQPPRTGQLNSREIPVTQMQIDTWASGGRNIQDVMPDLSADDREFLMTGYTPEDWAAIFPPEEDEGPDYSQDDSATSHGGSWR